MEFNNLFQNVKGDPEKVSDIVFKLGLTRDDMSDPVRNTKLLEVINTLASKDDYSYYINKLTLNKNVDKIDHLWGFFALDNNKRNMEGSLEKLQRSIAESDEKIRSGIEISETERAYIGGLINSKNKIEGDLNSINEQLSYY